MPIARISDPLIRKGSTHVRIVRMSGKEGPAFFGSRLIQLSERPLCSTLTCLLTDIMYRYVGTYYSILDDINFDIYINLSPTG